MNALDLILRRRNANNTGTEEISIPAAAFQHISFNATKDPVAGQQGRYASPTLITGAGVTVTAAQVLSGVIAHDPSGSNRTDTLPTAALLLAAAQLVGLLVNDFDYLDLIIYHSGSQAATITVNPGDNTIGSALSLTLNTAVRVTFLRTSATTLAIFT